MLYNVSNDSLNTGNSISIKEGVNAVEKTSAGQKNPYSKVIEFNDTCEVSEMAKTLLQRDEYVKQIMGSPLSPEEINSIAGFLCESIDNDKLAESMMKDHEFLSSLFQELDVAS
jgi:hypothetical protein